MLKINLGTEPIGKIFKKYLIPSILIMITQNIAIIVDSFFIGNYIGPTGLSAITLFYPLVNFFIGITVMIAVGGSNLAGISLGKNNTDEANRQFNIALRLLGVFTLLISFIGIFFMKNLAFLLDVSTSTKGNIIAYGSTISIFFGFFMITILLSLFIKSEGKPQLIVISFVVGTAFNMFLDYLLIAVFKQSLFGAALATGMSQVVIFLILLYHFVKGSFWSVKKIQYKISDIWKICLNGSSQFLNSSANAIAGFVFNLLILNYFGELGVAGYAVALQVTAIVASIGNGVGEASRAGISFNYGLQKFDRVKKLRRLTILTNLVFGAIIALSAFFMGSYIANFFVNDSHTIDLASNILEFYSIGFIVLGFNISTSIYYGAIDSPIVASSFTLFRCLLIVIFGLVVLPAIFQGTGIWLTLILKEMSAAIAAVIILSQIPYGFNKINQSNTALKLDEVSKIS